MNIPAEFDEIRPYSPEELPQIFKELLADPSFQAVLTNIIPGYLLKCLLQSCINVRRIWMYRRHFPQTAPRYHRQVQRWFRHGHIFAE